MRIKLFEFEDLPWFPDTIRQGMTDYLRYLFSITKIYEPVIPVLAKALEHTGSTQIIDLCSGGGGPVELVQQELSRQCKRNIKIILTDKFPNNNAFRLLEKKTNGNITYAGSPVDATVVPVSLKGFRTLFSGVHHFDKSLATSIIQNAVDAKEGIAIFDGGDKNIFMILAIILFQPISFFFLTPFFKPFRFSRLLFTYLIPIIPFCTVWDGVVSILRLYQPEELLKMAEQKGTQQYHWKAGKLRSKMGMRITYLIGYPR